MRSIWKGTIDFGAAAIPVRVYGATEERGTGLHQLHETDGGRVKAKRVCELDEVEIPFAEIAKGFQLPGGDVVVLTEADLASLPLPTTSSIQICGFTPLAEVDPIYFGKSYYLEPEPAGTKPYVLLSEALQQSCRVAVVKVALRQRESLGVLRVRQQLIVLETMLWPNEIRVPDFPFQHEDVDLGGAEIRAVAAAIEQLSGPFQPEQYTDHYAAALRELVQAKVDGLDVRQPTAAVQQAGAADLLSALQASLAAPPTALAKAVDGAKAAARKAAAARGSARRAARKAGSAAKARD